MMCELILSISALAWPLLGVLAQSAVTSEVGAPPAAVGVGIGLPAAGDPTPQQKLMAKRAAEIRALRNALIGQVDQLCEVAGGVNAGGAQIAPAAAQPGKMVRRVSIQTTIIRTPACGSIAPGGPAAPVVCGQPVISPITCGAVRVEGQTGSFRVLETTQLPSGAYQARVVVSLPQPLLLSESQQSAVVQAVQNRVSAVLEERARVEQELGDIKAELVALERHMQNLSAQKAALEARLGAAQQPAPAGPASGPSR